MENLDFSNKFGSNTSDELNFEAPVFLNESETNNLNARGFLISKIEIPLSIFLSSIVERFFFWIILFPFIFTILTLRYDLTYDSLSYFIYIFVGIGLVNIAKYIKVYFLSRYVFISRRLSLDTYIIGGSTDIKEWRAILTTLTGKGSITNDITNAIGEKFQKMMLIYSIIGLIVLFIYSPQSIIFLLGSILILILIESQKPLYAFGNIGKKIQNLTPQIEEQSKKIQSEFQSDMNFSVLSDGFDSLSATFSEIVSLVIKLEKIESKANKGNLFDSEKYINSLRSDIITPLLSLKEFLENQKNTLLESQKELIQVRVGGKDPEINSGGQEHIELQSKRSESLIVELTENIEKLDMMIGKMG